MAQAEIIAIGDELLVGRTLDTNSHWLAGQLVLLGLDLRHICVIGDTAEAISQALDRALARSQAVLMTGGLGPTQDDVTRQTLSAYFNSPLQVYQPALDRITAFYQLRGRPMHADAGRAAWVPACATPLDNAVGAAPGMHFVRGQAWLFCMPGVPYEMKHLFTEHVAPLLSQRFGSSSYIRYKVLRQAGITESSAARLLRPVEQALPLGFKLAYNPSLSSLDIRLGCVVPADRQAEAQQAFDGLEQQLRGLLAPYTYAEDETTLPGALAARLLPTHQTLAVAESCTGGAISAAVVSQAGCSAWYLGGVVAYQNELKTKLLGVPEALIAQHGAVSAPVVRAMAQGVRTRLGAHYGLAVTGIAGPGGGTPDKPVGTVWIGLASPQGVWAWHYRMDTDRHRNIARTVTVALDILRRHLDGQPYPDAVGD